MVGCFKAVYTHSSEAKIRLHFQGANLVSREVIFQSFLQTQVQTGNSSACSLVAFLCLSAQVFY